MKATLVKALSSALYYSGALALLRPLSERIRLERRRLGGLKVPWPGRRGSRFVQVFTYHRVNDEGDPFLPATPTTIFDRQTRYLAKHYAIIEPNELPGLLERAEVPKRAVLITFDDGYRDVFLNAFPILSRHGAPAIVFLPTDHIGTGRVLWHDQVARAFAATARTSAPTYDDNGATLPLATEAQRVAAFRATMDALRRLPSAERAGWLDRLWADLDVPPPAEEPGLMMTWDEVRAMQEGGVSFGSHTVTHPILSRLEPAEALAELSESKERIEAELGRPVHLLAYPNGTAADFAEATQAAAREAGYTGAFTTIFGVNHPRTDLFELRRGGPWEEHLPTFALKLFWYRLTS